MAGLGGDHPGGGVCHLGLVAAPHTGQRMIRPGLEPYAIPLAAIQSVVLDAGECLIRTSDLTYPSFTLDNFLNADLVKQLKRQVVAAQESPTG